MYLCIFSHTLLMNNTINYFQFRAPSPTSTSNATAASSSTTLPSQQHSVSSTESSKSSTHVASSLETLRTSTTASSSVNTVLFNPPRVSAPTLKKSPSQPQPHSCQGSNSFTSSSSVTPGSSMTLSRSFTTTAASSHLSTRYQKRGSGNSSSFHSSDDSGFSNESGSLRPPANPDADYSDEDLNG